MRALLTTLGILSLTAAAFAGSPPAREDVETPDFVPCNLQSVCIDWDFAVSDHGFTTTNCDPTGGGPAWAYGNEVMIPGSPGNVWGTVLNGDYANNTGEGLVSPPFDVTSNCYLVEINHFVHIETNFDGGNVSVNGVVIPPTDGYPAVISTSTSFYAFCVDLEEGFTGNSFNGPSEEWTTHCFDLTPFIGQNVRLQFDFGTDSSVSYPGWYLAYVKVGGEVPTPVEPSTWGEIKNQFK